MYQRIFYSNLVEYLEIRISREMDTGKETYLSSFHESIQH